MSTQKHSGPETTTHSGAAFFADLLDHLEFEPAAHPPRLLVVGCGTGHEAAYLQQRLEARVDAIDVGIEPDSHFRGVEQLHFQQASVLELPFDDRNFDLVFYHHVIEHVSDPPRSIVEIARVIRRRGWLFIGTPNRHRLISSVGAHRQATWEPSLKNKLKDNVQDWGARLTGRFRNELGAHAGFTKRELDRLLAPYFSTRHWVTKEYLDFKYGDHALKSLVPLATALPVRWFMAPSIYVVCQR